MKKLISMILALTMIFSLSLTVMASQLPEDTVIDVTADFEEVAAAVPSTIYAVTITWEPDVNNNLTYTDNGVAYVWNPTSLKYEASPTQADDGWSGSAKYTINAVNRSNAAVNATITVNKVLDGIEPAIAFADGQDNVLEMGNAADGVTFEESSVGSPQEDSVEATVTVPANAPAISENNTKVATITITLTEATPADGE
ncbi:MAG: hypothetical protein IJN67_15055 [Oscillospiraceae bacterium]|nr:hypothetical protein [Oscillospiraceae bacterium]MBQ7002331.1 hypothetical protein [Oscillospiraceae bacterium]